MSSSFCRKAWIAVTLTAAIFTVIGSTTPAQAADPAMADLLEILRKRGSLTEEEYRALSESAAKTPPVSAAPAEAESGESKALEQVEDVEKKVEEHDERLEKAEKQIEEHKSSILRIKEVTDGTSSDLINETLAGKWYERLQIRGYTQFRVSRVVNQSGAQLEVPVDRSNRDNEFFSIRRGRLVVSGDVTDRLFFYAQADINAFIGSNEAVAQMRDLYGDIALDAKKEWRLRFGLSKLPFGFSNMQSSQNRAALERPDAINSTIEGERDYGAYIMWAPQETRLLFKDIVKRGLKGSGDYGVVAFGVYNGQGSNRPDLNGEPHVVGRVAYPFQFANGQIMELGAQYHWGHYVTNLSTITFPGGAPIITPSQPGHGAIDQRGGFTFVWYPQPFGIEAEWNVGQGPELNPNSTRIESRFLHGGYIQANLKKDTSYGIFFPFVRWNYYKGGRKFGNNAPHSSVNELDFGLEYTPIPEVELTLQYTRTFDRTNARIAFDDRGTVSPYDLTKNADRLGVQVQWNY